MTGAPTGAPQQAAASPDPTKRYQDLLFQETAGTISPQDANDLGILRKSGRLAGLDAKLDAERPTAAGANLPPGQPGVVPFSPEPKPWAGPDTDYAPGGILAAPKEPARNFADSFTERMGYGAIPGEAPNTGSLKDQAYRVINRMVGAIQGGIEKGGDPFVRSPGGWPVDVNLRPVIQGAGEALNWGAPGAAPGAAVEAATGSRGAGDTAELAANYAPLGYGLAKGGARLLSARPAAIARQLRAAEGTIPGLADEAVAGGRRLGGELLRDVSRGQRATQPPASVARRSYTLANTPEPPGGPLGQPPGVAKLRTATRATGEPPIIRADVPAPLSAARNVVGNQETAIQNFQKWLAKADNALEPASQQKYLEKAIRTIDQHFPNAQLPELDALRGAHQRVAELTNKLGRSEAAVRTIKRGGGWLLKAGISYPLVKSLIHGLSTGPGGPGIVP